MELEQKIQERNIRTRMNASHDPFLLKFPPEITSRIFSLSTKEQEDDFSLFRSPTQFLLATVCRGWRQLARSTPELWTSVSFNLSNPTKVESLHQLQAVNDWLQLSGSLLLSFWVFWSSFAAGSPKLHESLTPSTSIPDVGAKYTFIYLHLIFAISVASLPPSTSAIFESML
jgi:hypothetical protein